MSTFADNFRALLRARRLDQVKAAEQLGVTQATISRWLSGQHAPSFAALMKIAAKMDAPVEEFRQPKQGGKPVVRESHASYGATPVPTWVLESLKRRWKRAGRAERKAIEVDLSRLFPGHEAAIVAWLNAP